MCTQQSLSCNIRFDSQGVNCIWKSIIWLSERENHELTCIHNAWIICHCELLVNVRTAYEKIAFLHPISRLNKIMSGMKLQNYVLGEWVTGGGKGKELFNAVNGELIVTASSDGIDFGEMLQYGRSTGGPALRKMTFHERGRMLKALAFYLSERKAAYYDISYLTGATKVDSWIDIDGGIGNLFAYSSLRRQFPDERFYVDGEMAKLSKHGTFIGHHIMVPREGVAIHINAFNFPVWGMLEKIAVNLLAGVPAVVKPATITSYLTEAVVKILWLPVFCLLALFN